jgi:hypothetical protein
VIDEHKVHTPPYAKKYPVLQAEAIEGVAAVDNYY